MGKRPIPVIVSLAIFLIAALYSAFSTYRSRSPNVLIVTVESLRDDLVNRENTPALIEAAAGATRFTNHRAVSGWTGTNIVSLLSGLSPFESGVHTRGQSVARDRDLPLHVLSRSGYQVEGIQGFMVMDIYRNLGLNVRSEVDDLRYWLSSKALSAKPFFGWYHYVDTHLPYSPVPGYRTPTASALLSGKFGAEQGRRLELVQNNYAIHFDEAVYQEQDRELIHDLQKSTIREFDDWFAQLWEFFNKSGLRRNTILLITADHGDEHGERGYVGHASTTLRGHLHEEIVRVPLFVWLPERLAMTAPSCSSFISTHEDVMTTILDLLNQSHDLPLKGRNLFGAQIDSEWKGMTSSGGFAEPDPLHIDYFEYALLSFPWKLRIRIDHEAHVSRFLYNLETDPGERIDQADAFPDKVEELTARLSPSIRARTILQPDAAQDYPTAAEQDDGSVWIHPSASGTFAYDDLHGRFRLEWRGFQDSEYIVEYVAGSGGKQLRGFLEVNGTVKDFGQISRRYWNTWIVPNSPFRLRVREISEGTWSTWIELEAIH